MRHCCTPLLLALFLTTSVQGAIIYSGLQNIPIPLTFDGVYLDLDTSTHSTSVITGWDINPFFAGQGIANSANFQPLRVGADPMDAYLNMTTGVLISSGSSFFSMGEGGTDSNHLGMSAGQFQPGEDGLLGFAFTPNMASTVHYGWMRLNLNPGLGTGFIRDWAYNSNESEGIFAGLLLAAPEPSRCLLLILGGSFFLQRRRRIVLEVTFRATC